MDSNLHDRNGGVGRGGCRGHRGARWADPCSLALGLRSRRVRSLQNPLGLCRPPPLSPPSCRPLPPPTPAPWALSPCPGLSTGPDTWLVPPTQADEALGGPVWSPAVPTPAWGTRRRSPAKRVHPRGIGHPVLPPHPRPAAVPSATACLSTLRFPPSQGTTVQSGGSSAQRHPAGPVAAPHLTDCGDSGWPRICPSVSLAGELGGRSLAG